MNVFTIFKCFDHYWVLGEIGDKPALDLAKIHFKEFASVIGDKDISYPFGDVLEL